MSYITVSTCLIAAALEEKRLITEVLHRISSENTPYILAVDSGGVILEAYGKFAEKNQHIASWIGLLTMPPTQIDKLEVDINSDTEEILKFIKTAAKIRTEKRLIVDSSNNIPAAIEFDIEQPNSIRYEGERISVYSRAEAIDFLAEEVGPIMNVGGDLNMNEETNTTTNTTTGVGDVTNSIGNTDLSIGNSNSGNTNSNIASGHGNAGNTNQASAGSSSTKLIITGAIAAIVGGLILWYIIKIL